MDLELLVKSTMFGSLMPDLGVIGTSWNSVAEFNLSIRFFLELTDFWPELTMPKNSLSSLMESRSSLAGFLPLFMFFTSVVYFARMCEGISFSCLNWARTSLLACLKDFPLPGLFSFLSVPRPGYFKSLYKDGVGVEKVISPPLTFPFVCISVF